MKDVLREKFTVDRRKISSVKNLETFSYLKLKSGLITELLNNAIKL